MQGPNERLLPQISKDCPDDAAGDEITGGHAGNQQARFAEQLLRRLRSKQMQAHRESENGNTGEQQDDDGHGEEQNGMTKVRDPARARGWGCRQWL